MSEDFRELVQRRLDAFLDEQAVVLAALGPDAARLLTQARTATRGGKRLRAAFCRAGHRAVVAEPDDRAVAAVAAAGAGLELLHASALVHDDLMDASDTRRGRPATHRALAAEHAAARWRGDPEQYGAAGAILLGDLLQAWADQLLRRCGLGWEVVGPALELFDLCRAEVIAGQFLDVSVQARGAADVDEAMTVLRYKSAKYSVERPLHIGAALGGASPAALAALSAYGVPLGEAFQLRDDVLGVFGDAAQTGKPAGDDLVEGKRTVLVALALDAAAPADAARLDGALGRPLDPAAVQDLRGVIEASGARAQVEDVIALLTERALDALDRGADEGHLEAGAVEGLRGLAAAATQRTV